VGESRYGAGLLAEHKFGPHLHILDDGFQHRSLARDFDIVLITPEDLKDDLLPTGRLRELPQSLRRANAVVLSGDLDASRLPISGSSVWRIRRDMQISSIPTRPLVFCGIARPQAFVQQLRSKGVAPVAEKFYRDHHLYSDSDVEDLLRRKAQNRADGFITTEKDAVNLGSRICSLDPVAIAQVTMEIVEPAEAVDTLLRLVHARK